VAIDQAVTDAASQSSGQASVTTWTHTAELFIVPATPLFHLTVFCPDGRAKRSQFGVIG
jgi:hypothetical protein